MKEEILNEIAQLQEEIGRLEKEYKIYSEHSEEESEPIKYNIDKKKWKIEELLKPVKEELKENENEKNNKIEEITKEAEERIERLEQELKGYIHDEEASEPIKYNINKIKWELEKQIKDINEEFETEKSEILNKIEETGIDLEEYELKEKEKIEIEEENKQNKAEEQTNNESLKKDKEEIKESSSKIVNPIIANKATNNKEDIEIIDLDKEEKEITENSQAIRILYSAKTDKYIVTNINTKEQKIINRKELEKLDKNLLAEKMGKDLDNVDTNILQLLISYDKQYKTHKADEYIETLSAIGMNKEQRQNEMKESQIDIEYNLKGLYDKHEVGLDEYEYNLSEVDRKELLSIANNAKQKGIATIKKGPKVFINELIDKMVNKIKNNKLLNKNKILTLPKSKRQKEYEKRKQEEYDKLTNKEYMQSLDKDFIKAVREEKLNQFKEKISVKNIVEKHIDVGASKDNIERDEEDKENSL